MLKRILVLSALTCFGASAMAAPIDFEAGYTIDAHDSGDGLLIETWDVENNPFDFALDLDGVSTYSTDLFRIWTEEGSVENGEDTDPSPISVDFSFLAPEVGDVTATGTTSGVFDNFIFIYWTELGELVWDAPTWNYNFGNGGLLQISLFDTEFNEGPYDLREGYTRGADVGASFTLLAAPSSVPEPGTLVLLGASLFGFGLVRNRRTRT